MVTGLVTVNGNSLAADRENPKRRHGSTQRFGRTLHHITRNKTINKLQQLERERKNSRILRTHHHDPRPPGILSKTVNKSRCRPLGDLRRRFSDDLSMLVSLSSGKWAMRKRLVADEVRILGLAIKRIAMMIVVCSTQTISFFVFRLSGSCLECIFQCSRVVLASCE